MWLAMYLLYLDESGDPNHFVLGQNHFVLGGVAIHEGQIFALSKSLDAIQNRYFPSISIPINFHATEIRGGSGRYREFLPKIREQILKDIYDIIKNARFPNLIAFATVINVDVLQDASQARPSTLEDVCIRFNTFVMRQYKHGLPNKGLLIIDRNRAEEYRKLLRNYQEAGTRYGYLGNIVDIPYFARCHETRMLQLADFCAYAVFRYYERNDDRYLKQILPRFDRRRINQPDGLKHIIKAPCKCIACSWR